MFIIMYMRHEKSWPLIRENKVYMYIAIFNLTTPGPAWNLLSSIIKIETNA